MWRRAGVACVRDLLTAGAVIAFDDHGEMKEDREDDPDKWHHHFQHREASSQAWIVERNLSTDTPRVTPHEPETRLT